MLLQRSAEGALPAFETFVRRHQASLHRFCTVLTRGTDDVDDVLQETFLTAWRRAGTFAGKGSARSWLFTIARRSHYRSHRRERPVPLDDESLEQLGSGAGWGGDLRGEGIENRALVRELFGRLGRADRLVLLLRDVEGLSTREAAEALGIESRALKSRLHRARLRLMGLLQVEAPDER